MSDATRLLELATTGNAQAAEDLLPIVYEDLRRLAAGKMGREPAGLTLTPTALVHEAYLRLIGSTNGGEWANRRHFFAAAAEAMRRILVENARRKKAIKYGGGLARHDIEFVAVASPESDDTVLAVHEALDAFALVDPAKAELVKLRFFVGLTTAEAAELLGVSVATAERNWQFARAWLFAHISGPAEEESAG